MATCTDHNSNLADCIAYPVFQRPGARTDSGIEVLPTEDKPGAGVSTNQDVGLFHDALIVSGPKSHARNPWAAAGSLAVQLLLVAAAIVIPLFHIEPLPKREALTILVAPPAAGAASATRIRATTPGRPERT